MIILRRGYSDARDLQMMKALARQFPDDNLHVVDLPYRFSSWAMDYPENVGLWTDAEGELLGWAVMQTPFWTIDYAYHPKAGASLHKQILTWVNGRAQKIVDTPSGRPSWFISVFPSQIERIRDLEEAGFASQADVGEYSWTKVLMQRPERNLDEAYTLPAGFKIRALAGEEEVAAYVELHQETFESKSMTVEWRMRTLQCPEYSSDLDLVVVAPDGRLAAFCICWLHQEPVPSVAEVSKTDISGQIEPLGVHAEFRKLGLGKSILSAGLRRLQLHGVKSIYVETDNYRDEAFMLYESFGFRVQHDVLVYRKDFAGT